MTSGSQAAAASKGKGPAKGKAPGKGKQQQQGSVRHRKKPAKITIEDNIRKPAIRRVMRRGGVKYVRSDAYPHILAGTHKFTTKVIKDALTFTAAAKLKTIPDDAIKRSFARNGMNLFGETD